MKKNKIIYVFLKLVLNVYLVLSTITIMGYAFFKLGFIDWMELEPVDFYPKYIGSFIGIGLVLYISCVISIIWHELGHLLWGNKAKLKFISFNFLKFTITKENDKLVLEKGNPFPGTKGFCYMSFNENKEYTKKDIISYFMGGIVFNFILAIMFSILLVCSNNIYLDIISLIFININIYFALYNLVPSVQKSGANSDMLQIINHLNDPEYIKVLSRYFTIQNLLSSGCELKDIDENLFYMPNSFSYSSEVLMAQFYIDYISEKEKYQEAIECIKKVMKEADNLLSKADRSILKIQLINCVFYADYDIEIISEYWDNDIKKYLDLMGKFAPQMLGYNYMCTLLLEKDEKKSQKYLSEFEQMKKKHPDKKAIEETEKIIADVNNKIK